MKRGKKPLRNAAPVSKVWEKMPWKPVDPESLNLGEFNDAVFYGLEELDGNQFILNKKLGGYSVKPTFSSEDETAESWGTIETIDAAEIPETGTEEVDAAKLARKQKRQSLKELRKLAKQQQDGDNGDGKETSKAAGNKKSKTAPSPASSPAEEMPSGLLAWGEIQLQQVLTESLNKLGFVVPTPIQALAIPMILRCKHDIVGAAETGSGKTLAFCLPVLNYIIQNACNPQPTSRCPRALIVAPTRELALQITAVLKEVCNNFSKWVKVQVVAVVGGMAEQKQRRLLSDKSRFVDIIVGTPGRLCELVQDDEIVVFQDMSRLRFLIVDEADRIMEEGHFPELHRLFNRIRDHEKLYEEGLNPKEEASKKKIGTFGEDFLPAAKKQVVEEGEGEGEEEGDEDDEEEEEEGEGDALMMAELAEFSLPGFDAMPTEEQMAAARLLAPVRLDEDEDDAEQGDGEEGEEQEVAASLPVISIPNAKKAKADSSSSKQAAGKQSKRSLPLTEQRQTLLFSATAIQVQAALERHGKKKAEANKKRKRNSETEGLPDHLQQLLALVGVKSDVHVVDVTGAELARKDRKEKEIAATAAAAKASGKKGKQSPEEDEEEARERKEAAEYEAELKLKGHVTLPKGLTQFEIKTSTEDKDVMAYYFLLKNSGRTLLFVNSIKAARRVDGLLRALGLNSRAIHAQLQQRQRLRALESYRESPSGILVATDVAARGLDIPMIQSVLHYDVARSPQVYVHRSGRTARAGQSGVAISLVSPEDTPHHAAICSAQSLKNFPLYKDDLTPLPSLRARVKLAKKIFTQSFVLTQDNKQQNWLLETAREADLTLDENLLDEVGDEEVRQKRDLKAKKALEIARGELKTLLSQTVPGLGFEVGKIPTAKKGGNSHSNSARGGPMRRGGMVVFAK